VILSGHSQGSVLVAAAYLQLPADVRQRAALLTYGSPLCRLYSRFFPAYFGRTALRALAADMTPPAAKLSHAELSHTEVAGDDVNRGEAAATANGRPVPARGRWINLWRATDPIGGAVGVAGVDRRFVDPLDFQTRDGDTVPPAVFGHSGYPADDAFAHAVAELAATLATAPPAGERTGDDTPTDDENHASAAPH
jgi:hypothetical protein